MAAKKPVTKEDIIFDDMKITLRSVYDKSGNYAFIQPCADKYGNLPPCVKKVNAQGDMIMSEKERNDYSEGKAAFFPEDHLFKIPESGKTYDLSNIWDRAEWECIKNCKLIAKSRDERDANGDLIIDGPISTPERPTRNGVAIFYIDRPGLDTQRRVSKAQKVHNAEGYIFGDDRGAEGRVLKAKILGKDMKNQPDADVVDYLLRVAKENPDKIINLYTGGDTSLRLLFIEAKQKRVIYMKNKLYLYGDEMALGATDDAVIAWMKDAKNAKVLELIKKDTYPDYFADSE